MRLQSLRLDHFERNKSSKNMSRRHLITRFLDLFKSYSQHYLDKSISIEAHKPFTTQQVEARKRFRRFCGYFVLSFVRFVALYKSPKRRNEISFWRLFVLSPSIRRQNEQTNWPYPASIIVFVFRGIKFEIHKIKFKIQRFLFEFRFQKLIFEF